MSNIKSLRPTFTMDEVEDAVRVAIGALKGSQTLTKTSVAARANMRNKHISQKVLTRYIDGLDAAARINHGFSDPSAEKPKLRTRPDTYSIRTRSSWGAAG
jgi:hypothetical protein